jgi:23S rRNA pseudouridine1911/1915/1917 synthase
MEATPRTGYPWRMPTITSEHLVPDGVEPQRLDHYAAEVLPEIASRTQARKLRKKGALRVNGEREENSIMVTPGDRFHYVIPATNRRVVTIPEEIVVVWEDEHMAVIVKPAGLRTSGPQRRTLVNVLPGVLRPSTEPDVMNWPHTVHRLDIRTGGLIVCAKTHRGNVGLGRVFQERQVQKRYEAIAVGRLEGEGQVDIPVEGRTASTLWKVRRHVPSHMFGWLTEVHAWPLSGRNHQIRRHLASLGHPILGDDLYTGDVENIQKKGLYLWAAGLTLPHPVSGEMLEFSSAPGKRFLRYVTWHRDRFLDAGAPPIRAPRQTTAG